MEFRIADTFTGSLARLESQEQKAAKTTAFDLQIAPSAPGLKFPPDRAVARPALLVDPRQQRYPHHRPQNRSQLPARLRWPPRRGL